ncbi:MAG: biotin transporter BioY [Clostridiales bacterium]|nr:biotin transporter BioY [Clostridiales bacterium]
MNALGNVKIKTRDMVYISLFAVLIAICSWISVPATVPFTLQTFAVFLTVSVLGGKRGTIAICVYLLLGIVGIPVFAGGRAGIGVILGNTGGYLIGWIFAGPVMWAMEKLLGRKTWVLALGMVIGLIICYALGTAWFIVVYTRNVREIGIAGALGMCVIPFIIPDLIKIALALFVGKRLETIIKPL